MRRNSAIVSRFLRLAALVLCCASGMSVLSGSFISAMAQEQQTGEKKAAADKTTEGTAQGPDVAATPKPADKTKKVITNDDIQSSPYTSFGGLFYFSTGSINDCDESCFDQVRVFSLADTTKNPNWRRDVLRQIEMVRSDSEWQSYLRQLYAAHDKVCRVTFDKQDEQRMYGNTRNVGPQDIAISEKYDVQMKAAKSELDAAAAQQSVLQKKFADKPYAKAFAMLQGTRMQGGFCSQWKVIYPR